MCKSGEIHLATLSKPSFKQILDLFLDWHVERRMKNPSVGTEMVEIVTGRGNRSEGGKAKIKPAVIKRLKQRDVKWVSNLKVNCDY